MDGQLVVAAHERHCKDQILGLVGRIPECDHRIVAINQDLAASEHRF
jgi:hypothetical protein